ncbi:MAG: DUF2837 family protein [Thermoanaerobacterales bacterium]|nr:DUF2837 family protein [Thermoanaerobacterales bacterium]
MDRFHLVALLTALIHLIGTLVYVARFSGVRTKRLATAFSLYQVISLVAMTANMVQAPLLSLTVEQAISTGQIYQQSYFFDLEHHMRLIMLAATGGTALAGLFGPFFLFLFSRTIFLFERFGSLPTMILSLLSPSNFFQVMRQLCLALAYMIKSYSRRLAGLGLILSVTHFKHCFFPVKLFVINILVVGIWTTGVLSSLYAGALTPAYRATATELSGIVNLIAVFLDTFLVDPVTAVITDNALQGARPESEILHLTFWLVLSRLLGTLFAQLLFLPAVQLVKYGTLLLAQ